METKQCSKCGCSFPNTIEFFIPSKTCRNGLAGTCRACMKAYQKKWKEANYQTLLGKKREYYREYYKPISASRSRSRLNQNPLLVRAYALRGGMLERHRRLGIPFDSEEISVFFLIELLKATTNCPCCGVGLDISYKMDAKKKDNSPSMDRIHGDQGYVLGNIAILCWRCNNLKRDATPDELQKVVDWMRSVW
jgi:hypothetical protein